MSAPPSDQVDGRAGAPDLRAAIEAMIAAVDVPVWSVHPRVDVGVVTLEGWLPTELEVALAAERAMLVDGVHAVQNRIVSDERLVALARHELKRAGVDDRVDVSSRLGAVDLRGVVPNEALRAEILASIAAIGGVRSVVDRLATASERPTPVPAAA
jgi:osmotically-inducible protein OsmY